VMVDLVVNGAFRTVPGGSVLDLVAEVTGRALGPDGSPVDGGRLGVAVAVDGAVVPRSRWHATPLCDGRHVEIITAVQGG
jgi:sulfur carrier protein